MILLNTPSKNEYCIFVKTTSQKKIKRDIPGCLAKEDCFFLKKNSSWFKKDTWIQLFENYPMEKNKVQNSPLMNYKDMLPAKTTKDVIDCFLKTQENDLLPFIKNLISSKFDQSLLKLQEKFN